MSIAMPDGNDDNNISFTQEELDIFNGMCEADKLERAFDPVISEIQEYQMACYFRLAGRIVESFEDLFQKIEKWNKSKNLQSWPDRSKVKDMLYDNVKFEIISNGHFFTKDYDMLINLFNEFYVELFKESDPEAGINFLFGSHGKLVNMDQGYIEYLLPNHYIEELLSRDTMIKFASVSDAIIVLFKSVDQSVQEVLGSLQDLSSLGYGIDDVGFDLDIMIK